MSKFQFDKIWYFVGVLLLLNFAVWVALGQARPQDFAKLYFFDVGEGDAIYLRTVQGNDILIDGGPGDAVLSKLGRVMPFWDRTLELVILTHPHADHLAGVVEVLKRYQVSQVLVSNIPHTSATYQAFWDLLKKRGINVLQPKLGQRIFLDNQTVLDIFYPLDENSVPRISEDINDTSIISRLSFGKINVLLTGDGGKKIENLLLELKLPLASEILKVSHHGSLVANNKEFVETARPTYGIISVGENRYGHPDAATIQTLVNAGLKILRTDQKGDISFVLYPDRAILSTR